MVKPLRVLIVEDSEADASLLLRELRKAEYSLVHRRVETAEEMASALNNHEWDIVLSDYILPGFGGLAVIRMIRERGLDLPLIVVSGQIGEDTAAETMRAGANDYIMKGNLKRLVPAIERELAEALNRRQRREVEATLKAREEELRISRQVDIIKDEFIGMVSHELKTPLTVIIGALRV
ncbi:MAG: hybrid sensor histidine kinase/response regulator, partial [Chloroflexi bacterium]|nr:hybrid sensor histidine kinase/response regulator [Chloroflexota bacterium]